MLLYRLFLLRLERRPNFSSENLPPMDPGDSGPYCDFHLPIPADCTAFSLEKAVCSHGLFMMSPNQWDPVSKCLLRPLRLSSDGEGRSAVVRVSHSSASPLSLLVRVLGLRALSESQRAAVAAQVSRMLRLSESEDRKVRDFQSLHAYAKISGFGRLFRSPTLFEDMVKCILVCNCQWSRTLSMAKALCELQLELQNHPSAPPVEEVGTVTKNTISHSEHFCPKTPAGKESGKRHKPTKRRKILFEEETSTTNGLESGISVENHVTNPVPSSDESTPSSISLDEENKVYEHETCSDMEQNVRVSGNFPSPAEIAGLDEKYLAKRCSLGYRAGRILKLAQSVVEGIIQLRELEELCNEADSFSYVKLDEKLTEISGFGPFTRANVLMCMGFFNVIPTDSETIRHLKQVHGIKATLKTVQEVVEDIYGAFAPFQFLAYWLEVWNFYGEWFGELSKMSPSEYRLITASKMRVKRKS